MRTSLILLMLASMVTWALGVVHMGRNGLQLNNVLLFAVGLGWWTFSLFFMPLDESDD